MTPTTPPPGQALTAETDWRVGDFAVRLEDHQIVKRGDVHQVTKMYRGGYLGFAMPVGGEWNPKGWAKCDADGWIAWSGGDNPVGEKRVEYRLRSGYSSEDPADRLMWDHEPATGHSQDQALDIIAFRLASQSTAPTPPEPVASALAEGEGLAEGLYVAFWKRNGGNAPAWNEQAPAIRSMWTNIASDAAEAAAARIASLAADVDRLKLAICGGEDVPGAINAVTVEDCERFCREGHALRGDSIDRATQAEARADRLAKALEQIRDLGSDGEHSGDRHARCRDIAREALREPKSGGGE